MKSKLAVLFMVLMAIMSVAFCAVSAEAWQKGNLEVTPGVAFKEVWDSNIFYDPASEKDDFIHVITPSVGGEYTFGNGKKHNVTASYSAEVGIFSKYDDQNYGNHDVNTGLGLDFKNYSLDVNNRFQFTSSRAGTEFERRTLRKEDNFSTVLGWHFNKFDFDTGYEFFTVDYLSDTLDSIDRYDNSGWITGYMQLWPKTRGLLEFKYTNLQYSDATGRDGNAYRIMAGLEGKLAAKITGIAKAGYKLKAYDDSTHKDFSNAVAEVGLLYEPNDRTDLSLSYIREPYESTYTDNNYYTGYHVLANLEYQFAKDFVAKADAQYFLNQYPTVATGETKKRTDHEWSLGTGLDYHWKEWLIAGIGYSFHQRESNINARDYDQHMIMGDVRLTF